jgi:hypothetical protein
MNDPRRPEWFSPPQPGSGSTEPQRYYNPPLTDPAYADQAPYAHTYGGQTPQWAPNPYQVHPTQELPRYWQQDQAQSHEAPGQDLASPPPEGPRTPRWLVVAAVAAVLLVVASVIALIIVNGANKTQTAVEPLPPMPTPSSTLPTTTRHSRTPSAAPIPPTASSPSPLPTETTEPGAMQAVVYSVTGEGRAISISYMDAGDVVQTLFNVALPWSIEVNVAKSTAHPPILTIINIGHNVTCSVTVAGVQVRQRVGQGITICDAPKN